MLVWWALLGAGSAAAWCQDSEPPRDAPGDFPLAFDSEVIRITVGADSVTVDGTYVLLCRQLADRVVTLRYPYPEDPRLGGARTELLVVREPGGAWRPIPHAELTRLGIAAARWFVPLDVGERMEVRTVYRQALKDHFVRYIVTTTSAWGRPLASARFEIRLPEGARPTRFSFPFERVETANGPLWVYTATEFLPDRDIELEWRP
jgi:hypothetical protein